MTRKTKRGKCTKYYPCSKCKRLKPENELDILETSLGYIERYCKNCIRIITKIKVMII